MRLLAALLALLCLAPTLAHSASPSAGREVMLAAPEQQQPIDEQLQLDEHPGIRAWMPAVPAQAAGPFPLEHSLTDQTTLRAVALRIVGWEARARDRLDSAMLALPGFPNQIWSAFIRLQLEAAPGSQTAASAALCALVAAGIAVEWLVRRKLRHSGKGAEEYLSAVLLATVMVAVFFALQWPPLVRLVIAYYFTAYIVYRLAGTAIGHAAHPELHGRLKIVVAAVLYTVASIAAGAILGANESALQAIAFLSSFIILILGIELVWRRANRGAAFKTLLCLHMTVVWIQWCADLKLLFWLGTYIALLPPMLRAIGHAVRRHLASHHSIHEADTRSVLMVRGVRAAVIGLAVIWIALVWEMDGQIAGSDGLQMTEAFHSLLKIAAVLLLADLVWHLVKATVDRSFPHAITAAGHEAASNREDQEVHATRLHTLLPILRNVVGVALVVVAGLVILDELGVDTGPLIAGAGIFGVAVGFGSQALVKDIISGIFYLFDDAFRVGEYVQAGSYKGTVEGFSLRSIRLRHNRGPLFIVPFGELGAVENMSRDWSKAKFLITVPYDTDIGKARKIGKAIGQELLGDPELGPLFIEPLKMKGVEEFGAYGIVISFAMITLPTGQQSFIRRTAYAMLREAFLKNGIEFAQPMVQVGSGKTQEAGASAYHALELEKAEGAAAGRTPSG